MWENMERNQREMSWFFDFYSPRRYRVALAFPAMNIWSTDEGLMVTLLVFYFISKTISLIIAISPGWALHSRMYVQ
jgi:hypothetical protein